VSELQFLKRTDIDEIKWNDAITHSVNSLPYGYSWYLDAVAENWDGLVWNNYKAVMPLVWLRKLGLKCLYQPYYCQQLGVFGNDLNSDVLAAFLNYAIKNYTYVNINLNRTALTVAERFRLKPKKNLLLNLNVGHELLAKTYNDNTRRNIQKAIKHKLVWAEVSKEAFQEFYLHNIDHKKEHFKSKHQKIFHKLTQTLVDKGAGQTVAVRNESGILMAASLLVKHHNRIINLINTSSPDGKKNGASHLLFDEIFKRYAGGNVVFDFEGSSIPGVARFYEGFGATKQDYLNLYKTLIR
jgi:hypothetical protein